MAKLRMLATECRTMSSFNATPLAFRGSLLLLLRRHLLCLRCVPSVHVQYVPAEFMQVQTVEPAVAVCVPGAEARAVLPGSCGVFQMLKRMRPATSTLLRKRKVT